VLGPCWDAPFQNGVSAGGSSVFDVPLQCMNSATSLTCWNEFCWAEATFGVDGCARRIALSGLADETGSACAGLRLVGGGFGCSWPRGVVAGAYNTGSPVGQTGGSPHHCLRSAMDLAVLLFVAGASWCFAVEQRRVHAVRVRAVRAMRLVGRGWCDGGLGTRSGDQCPVQPSL
jgi:hypothetical protein